MSGRKRKADDDPQDDPATRMSSSPSPSPVMPWRLQPGRMRPIKKARTGVTGGPLPLPRLLETLSPDQLRGIVRTICDQHPQIGSQIVSAAPRPSVASALGVLANYEASLRDAFPYGDRPTAEYAYNRVRHSLMDLLEALRDYTPHFLPPNEQQPMISLEYLDGATAVIHHLPNWDSYQNNRHKQDAYEEIAQAWILVIREAAKKGGGIQLQLSGWDQKLNRHDQESGGRLQAATAELRSSLDWMGGTATGFLPVESYEDRASIRQQLMNGSYGSNSPVQVGPW
ncbi:MAG: hypothetical protein Q9162_001887 [Coniocarpon cinnabarinum]